MSAAGDRFIVVPMYGFHKGKFGIQDLSFTRSTLINNWKKGRKGPWFGEYEDAVHLAGLLNARHPDVDMVTKGDLSKSQLIHYVNMNRQKQERKTSARKRTMTPFKKCTCGAMYKGESHCE